ncbi:conserved protein, unknown function [Hepatocystis sp. ex Piliocolobus tephrosceles]|nr:conserved protein, unknown function [Hepatocystis sp. ex Piliocolobus tephrosceles]
MSPNSECNNIIKNKTNKSFNTCHNNSNNNYNDKNTGLESFEPIYSLSSLSVQSDKSDISNLSPDPLFLEMQFKYIYDLYRHNDQNIFLFYNPPICKCINKPLKEKYIRSLNNKYPCLFNCTLTHNNKNGKNVEKCVDNSLDNNYVDGDKSDGNKSDGNKSDGNKSDGNKSDGNKSDGNKSDGNKSDGNKSGGNKNVSNTDVSKINVSDTDVVRTDITHSEGTQTNVTNIEATGITAINNHVNNNSEENLLTYGDIASCAVEMKLYAKAVFELYLFQKYYSNKEMKNGKTNKNKITSNDCNYFNSRYTKNKNCSTYVKKKRKKQENGYNDKVKTFISSLNNKSSKKKKVNEKEQPIETNRNGKIRKKDNSSGGDSSGGDSSGGDSSGGDSGGGDSSGGDSGGGDDDGGDDDGGDDDGGDDDGGDDDGGDDDGGDCSEEENFFLRTYFYKCLYKFLKKKSLTCNVKDCCGLLYVPYSYIVVLLNRKLENLTYICTELNLPSNTDIYYNNKKNVITICTLNLEHEFFSYYCLKNNSYVKNILIYDIKYEGFLPFFKPILNLKNKKNQDEIINYINFNKNAKLSIVFFLTKSGKKLKEDTCESECSFVKTNAVEQVVANVGTNVDISEESNVDISEDRNIKNINMKVQENNMNIGKNSTDEKDIYNICVNSKHDKNYKKLTNLKLRICKIYNINHKGEYKQNNSNINKNNEEDGKVYFNNICNGREVINNMNINIVVENILKLISKKNNICHEKCIYNNYNKNIMKNKEIQIYLCEAINSFGFNRRSFSIKKREIINSSYVHFQKTIENYYLQKDSNKLTDIISYHLSQDVFKHGVMKQKMKLYCGDANNPSEQSKTGQNKTGQNKTGQNKTGQNKTGQNKSEQNKSEKNKKSKEDKNEENKNEENKNEENKNEENKNEENKNEENKNEENKSEENKNEENKNEENKSEENKSEENKNEENKNEENKSEENKNEENKSERSDVVNNNYKSVVDDEINGTNIMSSYEYNKKEKKKYLFTLIEEIKAKDNNKTDPSNDNLFVFNDNPDLYNAKSDKEEKLNILIKENNLKNEFRKTIITSPSTDNKLWNDLCTKYLQALFNIYVCSYLLEEGNYSSKLNKDKTLVQYISNNAKTKENINNNQQTSSSYSYKLNIIKKYYYYLFDLYKQKFNIHLSTEEEKTLHEEVWKKENAYLLYNGERKENIKQ